LIAGHVQGVSFRYAALRRASHLRVTGWVRNRSDGRVELVVEGDAAAVRELIAWCHDGPPGAAVDDVDVAWESPTGGFSGFDIAPTR
jgi:acylphosphatase